MMATSNVLEPASALAPTLSLIKLGLGISTSAASGSCIRGSNTFHLHSRSLGHFFHSTLPVMNSTVPARPFYDIQRSEVIPGLSDQYFALLGPVVAYWVYSMMFHILDCSNWAWPERYRIHESEEMLAKNKATLSEVIRAVLVQQVLQTFVGWYWVDQPTALPNHSLGIARLTPTVARAVIVLLGKSMGSRVLLSYGVQLVSFTYWWAIPAAQFLGAL